MTADSVVPSGTLFVAVASLFVLVCVFGLVLALMVERLRKIEKQVKELTEDDQFITELTSVLKGATFGKADQ